MGVGYYIVPMDRLKIHDGGGVVVVGLLVFPRGEP